MSTTPSSTDGHEVRTLCDDCLGIIRLPKEAGGARTAPFVCSLCLDLFPRLRKKTGPDLVHFCDDYYDGHQTSPSRELYETIRFSPSELAVSLPPIILLTCFVTQDGSIDDAMRVFDKMKLTAKTIVIEVLASSTVPSPTYYPNPSSTGILKLHVGLFSPHAIYPPEFKLEPSKGAVKAMLKNQKKNRLRTTSPNVVGSTGGSVNDNLEGRLFADFGVDVDTASYAESHIKVEDMKTCLKKIPPSQLPSLVSFLSDNYYNRVKYGMLNLPPSTEIGDSLRASVLTVISPPVASPLPPNFGSKSSYLADMKEHYPSSGLTKFPLSPTPNPTEYSTTNPIPPSLVAGKLCVLRGDSPRYKSSGHVIVARVISVTPSSSDSSLVSLSYYHDPHPSRENVTPSSAKWAIIDCSPPPPLVLPTFAISRTPIYVKGCYTKLSRLTAQTPFFVPNSEGRGMVRKGETSVEEEICSRLISSSVLKVCGHNDFRNRGFGRIKFHASGREDMDVRMLSKNGSGRPFVLEITDSSKVPNEDELREIETHICGEGMEDEKDCDYGDGGGGVGVRGLKLVGREDFGGLQKETEEKVKHYGCICWSSKAHTSKELSALLDSISSITIVQSTPIRVLHRRAQMKRSREVLYRRTEYINDHYFLLWIATSAGAYVKEFVTGDFGRTNPSVSTMLDCQCDIMQLDCAGIEMSK